MRRFQSPRGDFGFLKEMHDDGKVEVRVLGEFQSPRGDFGFLKTLLVTARDGSRLRAFQSPRGDFGFLK